MDTSKVIVLNEADSISSDKSNTKKSSDSPSNNKNVYSIHSKNMKLTENINPTVNEANITDDKVILEDYNENKEQNSFENKNEIFMNSKSHVSKDLLAFESLKQNDASNLSVVHKNIAELPKNTVNIKISSLTAIAVEYGNSDSETEDNPDNNTHKNDHSTFTEDIQMQSYRLNNISSSSEESDSDNDSTSCDSSVIIESDSLDSDDSRNQKSKGNKTKDRKNNKIRSELEDLPPIEDLKISVPEVLCDPLGEVAWMVEQLVVVRPKPDKPTLNLDTVLFVEKGQRALGKIFDVFGQVNEPHYCVRFNSSEHIKEYDIKVGMNVYYCPNTQYTSLVFLHELMKIKGIDVTADEPPEFSDDEEERSYYKKLNGKQASNADDTDVPFKRKRAKSPISGWQSNPWNRNVSMHRKGRPSRGDSRQVSSVQFTNQSQNAWGYPYQNNWSLFPRHVNPECSDQYGYGAYSSALQSMQYINPNVNNTNPNFYALQNYYNEDGTTVPLNSRFPLNACLRMPPRHVLFQNRSNVSSNLRFRGQDISWHQTSHIPIRTNTSWISLPPPPPPLPPPPSPTRPSSPSSSNAT